MGMVQSNKRFARNNVSAIGSRDDRKDWETKAKSLPPTRIERVTSALRNQIDYKCDALPLSYKGYLY